MIRLGMIGLSEGNGHPFSFSAIVNGYDPERLAAAGWAPINAYLDVRDPADLGFPHARVTHAWCPDPADTTALRETADIPHAVQAPTELIGEVDAVVIARDDWRSHWELAAPFLEAGLPVLVDKPLTLDEQELAAFRPFLDAGRLLSCSGYRFAPELDDLRPLLRTEPPVVVQGIGPRDWDRYAVHLLEPIQTLLAGGPEEIARLATRHDAALLSWSGGPAVTIHCLGDAAPGFRLDVTTRSAHHTVHLRDRFTAFRRLLEHFVRMVATGEPPFDPQDTVRLMRWLAAGRGKGATDAG